MCVIFLVNEATEQSALAGTSCSTKHWLQESEIMQQPKFVIDQSTVELLKGVKEKLRTNEAVYPCEVLECVGEERKVTKRNDGDNPGGRPQLVRAKSLEDQMLQQSGYGEAGKVDNVRIWGRVW